LPHSRRTGFFASAEERERFVVHCLRLPTRLTTRIGFAAAAEVVRVGGLLIYVRPNLPP
jgi:hypothetical protein